METKDLINQLSKDLTHTKGADSLIQFLVKATLLFIILSIVTLFSLPIRSDLVHQFYTRTFAIESFLWLSTGVLSGIVAYALSIPGLRTKNLKICASISLIALIVTILFGSDHGLSTLSEELDPVRGICGAIISIISILSSCVFFLWSRKHAPINLGATGLWIVLSSASLSSFYVQFVCAHDSRMHLYMWHVVPTLVLSGAGIFVGRKILKW